jgi:hypothetical protein
MNKNWLYRVLAMALIVMMALPFAMAEEVEAQTNNVEDVVASTDVALEGVDAVANDAVPNVEYGYTITTDALYYNGLEVDSVDMGIDEHRFIVEIDIAQSKYEDFKDTKWTISPSSAASVKKLSDTTAEVKLKKKKDEVTLKVAGKYSLDGEDYTKSRHTICEAKFEITNEYGIDKVKANYSDEIFVPDYPDKDETKTKYTVDIGEGDILIPFAVNGDNESVDYGVEEDLDAEVEPPKGWGVYAYKWSNTKVADYVVGDSDKEIDVSDFADDEEALQDFRVTFKKKGSSKVTFTNQSDKKKKATVTFKVIVPGKYQYKAASSKKPKAGKDNKVELVVKSAKYTDADTFEADVWIANGTGEELKGAVEDVVMETRQGKIGTGTLKFSKIKKQKVGVGKIKIESKYADVWKLMKLEGGVYVNEASVQGEFPGEEVECNVIEE